ncbi:FAD binding domain-containing protein [Halobacillus sp. ACCC02827]|uniref:FAD binding domain-containing protein n=1 Tax=Halobacillus sp. ACCC02827 TaxID=3052090 RepID=UPI0025700565|nr:FAD binding domain-containing protein [Halobacillus sp. ACCC02827]WJE14887.1 FAD binding domain-containing protein [Halobacillus sp. ACCC02827]
MTTADTPAVSSPVTLTEAWRLKTMHGSDAVYTAGGTILQLQREKGEDIPFHIVSLSAIPNLDKVDYLVRNGERELSIGAMTKLQECASHPLIQAKWPVLSEAASRIASPAVRNQAVIGGNVGYGIGDLVPALLVLGAKVVWFHGGKEMVEPLRSFIRSPKPKNMILVSFRLPDEERICFYRKVGRREGFIPSVVTVAGGVEIDSDQNVKKVRIAVGGGGYQPRRLERTELFLRDHAIRRDRWEDVAKIIEEDYHPAPTPFASEEYCRQVVVNIVAFEMERLRNELWTGGI